MATVDNLIQQQKSCFGKNGWFKSLKCLRIIMTEDEWVVKKTKQTTKKKQMWVIVWLRHCKFYNLIHIKFPI